MQSLITLLGGASAGAVLGWIVALFLGGYTIYKWAEKYRKTRNRYEDVQQLTHQNTKEIEELRNDFEDTKVRQKKHFDKLQNTDKEILSELKTVTESIDDLHTYQKKRDASDLRDRIQHNYRAYLERAKKTHGEVFITQNQLEAFEGLIESYEQAGGNSFIHTKIKPAILSWDVISENELIEKMRGGQGSDI